MGIGGVGGVHSTIGNHDAPEPAAPAPEPAAPHAAAARTGAPPAPPKVPDRVPAGAIPLPQMRQSDPETCGVDSLMSVMAYYGLGDDPNEKDLRKELKTTYKDGTEPSHLKQIAEKYGLNADIRQPMTLDDLARYAKQGTPVIVDYQAYADMTRTKDEVPGRGGHMTTLSLRNPDGSFNWANDWRDGHYSVVVAVDDKYVYLQDPSNGTSRSVVPKEEFDKRWHDTNLKNQPVFNHLGIVLQPKVKPPKLNEVIVENASYVP